jgi:ABC-type transporter Mla maintaining outer membrane lipid asymmetry ATPase subunit MlaF
MGQLVLSNLKKSFGDLDIIKGVNLDVTDGEFVVFVGPSGLRQVDAAAHDRRPGGCHQRRDDDRRQVGQRSSAGEARHRHGVPVYALYPHMTVFENIAFPLASKACPKSS